MSDNLGIALTAAFGIVSAGIALYAAYWAFAIRRALAGPLYRNFALSLGVVCVIFGLAVFGLVNLLPSVGSTISEVENNIIYFTTISVIFAFMDSAIRVARRSDPLLRSILHWEKLRFFVWGDIGLMVIGAAYLIVNPSVLTSSFAGFYIAISASASAQSSDFSNLLGITSTFFPLVVGTPVLLIGARRSRDPLLRGSLKWISIVLILLLATFFAGLISSNSFPQLATFSNAIFGILMGYALYRSTRSLAPINRLGE